MPRPRPERRHEWRLAASVARAPSGPAAPRCTNGPVPRRLRSLWCPMSIAPRFSPLPLVRLQRNLPGHQPTPAQRTMRSISRGQFLKLSAVLAGATGLSKLPFGKATGQPNAPPTPPQQPSVRSALEPDFIVVNGRVYTSDPALPRAEAFAVKDGRFLAVGSNADVRNLATARTRVVDAARMTVTPGFIDTHCHPSGVAELYSVNTNLTSISAIVAALKKKASETPPGYWVTGFMFDDTKLDDNRPLHRRDLDEVSRD